MLFPSRMKKATIVVHQDYLEDSIETLHTAGLLQIIDIAKQEPSFLEEAEQASMDEEAGKCTTYELRLTRVIDILKRRKKSPGGIKTLLKPQLPQKQKIDASSLTDLYSHAEEILSKTEASVLEHDEKIQELHEEKNTIQGYIQQITLLKDFDFNLEDLGESQHLLIKAGTTIDLEALQKEIKEFDLAAIFSQQYCKGKQKEWIVIIAAHKNIKDEIEQLCRDNLTELSIPASITGTPQKAIASLQEKIKKIETEKQERVSKLRSYANKKLPELLALREEIQFERARREAPKHFAKTHYTHVIKGWVLDEKKEQLKELISSVTNDTAVVTFETPKDNPDKPPTHLETPRWIAPFKTFLDLFATPQYNEINPTIFLGIFFIIFFGFMLGDAGYGLIILFLSLFGYLRLGKFSPGIKNWSYMGIWLGVATTIVGILTNSFFGDLIPRFFYGDPNQALYSLTIAGVQFPVEPLREPLTILTLALVFGIIHLNLGIILGLYQSYRRKDYKSLVTQHFTWVPLQLGGGLLIGSFILDWQLSTPVLYAAMGMTVLGIILLFIHAGPTGFFDITGYVGDWLSYARLLALGLATAGMALAFNVVGSLVPDMIPVVGIVLLPIFLVIAHIANLGIQGLGAGVHSLRLQYVEFFNRFYSGGGNTFSPFKMRRKYTKEKE